MLTDVIRANVEVHTRMAASYNATEPHFRPENQQKVRRTLEAVRERAPGGKMLDLGCGTGFLIGLAADVFDEIHGVDVTQAMLDKVDLSSGKVTLHNGPAENVPFDDDSFDVVTAYSFIHHTEDYSAVIAEGYRVLREGGVMYIDLEPNKLFWQAIAEIADSDSEDLSATVQREVDAVLHTDAKVEAEYGIPQHAFRLAEFTKAVLGGIDPQELEETARNLGFSACEVTPQWYLGQGAVMHGQSPANAEIVERYLRQLGPLSLHLFKYLQCILVK